jgi:serine/threonine protein kinase
MESSEFTNSQPQFKALESFEVHGATCDTFRVKLYGKLHFLKRLKPELTDDIRYQEAFRKEFETGYRLEHPHLVRYISLNDDGILMEYVDGETLTQRLVRQPEYFKNRKNTDKFIRQLLDAVGYLHDHQVLHLDLKPDNIMLTRIGDNVKIIDLGCCLTDTFADTPGRTPDYAAPEQLAHSGKDGQEIASTMDARTDIYAIGQILKLLPRTRTYNKVIARCTAPDKADRFPSVQALAHALTATHRHRRLWLFFAMMVTVLLTALLLWPYKRDNSRSSSSLSPASLHKTEIAPDTVLSRNKEQAVHPFDTTQSVNNVTPSLPHGQERQQVPWAEVESKLKHSIDSLVALTILVKADSPLANDWYEAHRRSNDIVDEIIFRYRKEYPYHAGVILTTGTDYFLLWCDSIFQHRVQLAKPGN